MARSPGRPAAADAGKLRARILDAAVAEFARAGYTGARIERIARAAGCNRALVYFHFKSKAGLFDAALAETAALRGRQMEAQPASLRAALLYWFERNLAEPERIRLVMQEALADRPAAPPPASRAAYLRKQLELVEAFQADGRLRGDIAPRQLLTIILALTSFPAAFPAVAGAALEAADASELSREWSRALEKVAELLAGPANGPS